MEFVARQWQIYDDYKICCLIHFSLNDFIMAFFPSFLILSMHRRTCRETYKPKRIENSLCGASVSHESDTRILPHKLQETNINRTFESRKTQLSVDDTENRQTF